MDETMQYAIDRLEKMQLSIMLWKRKTEDKDTKQTLRAYDHIIDEVIDILLDRGLEN